LKAEFLKQMRACWSLFQLPECLKIPAIRVRECFAAGSCDLPVISVIAGYRESKARASDVKTPLARYPVAAPEAFSAVSVSIL